MSTGAIIGVVVVLLLVVGAVVAYFMLKGGEETPTEYKYDFIINKAVEHKSLGSHITDIRADGKRVTASQIQIHVAPDHAKCNSKNGGYECEGENYGLNDPEPANLKFVDLTWTAWKKKTETVGSKVFTITTKSKVKEFEIDYFRPVYQPGWIIKENGVEVLKETENGGKANSPNPKTAKYIISV